MPFFFLAFYGFIDRIAEDMTENREREGRSDTQQMDPGWESNPGPLRALSTELNGAHYVIFKTFKTFINNVRSWHRSGSLLTAPQDVACKEACKDLQECFECTDWSVFYEEDPNGADVVADCFTDYVNFCTDLIIPYKTIKVFSNNKPWVSKEIKKAAFMSKDNDRIWVAQKNLKAAIRQGKNNYRDKIEDKLQERDTKSLWKGLKSITGYGQEISSLKEGIFTPDEANQFYARFDSTVDSAAHLSTQSIMSLEEDGSGHFPCPPIAITVEEVCSRLRRLKVNKAPGPDGIMRS